MANFRKFVTVAMMFGLMWSLPYLHTPSEGPLNPGSMAAFGFIVLTAYALGELAETWQLPHITGYLVAGGICGPSALGLLSSGVVVDLQLFNALAVALIGLSAGAALEWGELKRSARLLGSLIGAQFLVLLPLLGGLVLLFSGPIPGLTLPFLAGETWGVRAASALCIALIGSAMSPAATVAILHETRARGPVASAAMGVSVLNNIVVVVLFAIGLALALSLAPELSTDHRTESILVQVLLELFQAAVLGLLLGGGIALYIRWVNQELLLLMTALCFAVTWVAQESGIQPALPFILAGFFVRNLFAEEETEFTRVVNRLSLPVFVVFFFIAGAGLHLGAVREMIVFALLLFVGRLGGLYLGTAAGTWLGRGPSVLRRHGWYGFGAQAGIALYMAQVVAHSLGHVGHAVETLAVAGIALNELSGPVLLKIALTKAGEVREQGPRTATEELDFDPTGELDSGPHTRPRDWAPEASPIDFDPWRAEVPEGRLGGVASELRGGLQALVRDVRDGPVTRRRDSAHAFLKGFRREFLRHHRRCLVTQRQHLGRHEPLESSLRTLGTELAQRWENQILDRAAVADFRGELKSLEALVRAVDQLAVETPVALEVPLEPRHTAIEPGDPPLRRLSAAWLRLRTHLGTRQRLVEVRPIARYALEGRFPEHLVEVAGLLGQAERHLLLRARNLFEAYNTGLDEVLSAKPVEGGSLVPALEALRLEMEEEFHLAAREVDRLADETVRVTEAVLARSWRTFLELTRDAGTPLVTRRTYRFSRVYETRRTALRRIRDGLRVARILGRGLAASQAMELELIRLEGRVALGIRARGEALARDLRSRVTAPADRVTGVVAGAVDQLRPVIENPSATVEDLIQHLPQALDPIEPVVEEALHIAEGFRTALKTETELEPLVVELHAHIDELTDRFQITEERTPTIGRGLPTTAEVRDIHFRDVVRQYLDVQIGRDLSAWAQSLQSRVEHVFTALEEIHRSLGFNKELALTEVTVLPAGPLPERTRVLLDEVVLRALEKQQFQVADAVAATESLADEVRRQLTDLVLGHARELETLLVEGRWTEVKLRLVRGQVTRRRQLLSQGETPWAGLQALVHETAERWVGPDLTQTIRRSLGLREEVDAEPLSAATFRAAGPRLELPAVYRRLFSDPALEAGDLLRGREHDVERIRRALSGVAPGTSRAVAVVGPGGPGQSSVVNAVLRGLAVARVSRHPLSGPVTQDQVRFLLAQATGDVVMVIEGLEWLTSLDPEGLAPLRALLLGIVADRGSNAWMLSARWPAWTALSDVVGLGDIFPEVLNLQPLEPDALERALMARHGMSGYEPAFSPRVPTIQERLRALLGGPSEHGPERTRFFRNLHQRSGGELAEAQRLWMAAVDAVDSRRSVLTLGDVPPGPAEALERLPDTDRLTLRLVARAGRITAQQHARWLRWDESASEAHLARLEHWGLLVQTDWGYDLSHDLEGPLLRHLSLLGWLR